MLHALDFSLAEPQRVVVTGEPSSDKFQELLRAAHSVYQPDKIVSGNAATVEEFARTLTAKNGAVAYLCMGGACQPPTGDAAKLKELLSGKHQGNSRQ